MIYSVRVELKTKVFLFFHSFGPLQFEYRGTEFVERFLSGFKEIDER
jgi:hypothetical protein